MTFAETIDFNYRVSHFFDWDLDGSLFCSLFVMLIILVLAIIVGVKATKGYKNKDYLKKPKGLMHLAEIYFQYIDNFTISNMGIENRAWGGYLFTLFLYLCLSFFWGATGFPSITDWLAAPLCLSLIMFTLIQVTAIRYQHFSYFHRYIEPFAVFLPINLVTMWAPILSTTMRIFGNSISGWVVLGLIQWALGNVSTMLVNLVAGTTAGWTGIFLAPIPMGVLNLYFTLFSGAIQTLVFGSLNAIWIANEIPHKEIVSPALNDRARPEPVTE